MWFVLNHENILQWSDSKEAAIIWTELQENVLHWFDSTCSVVDGFGRIINGYCHDLTAGVDTGLETTMKTERFRVPIFYFIF